MAKPDPAEIIVGSIAAELATKASLHPLDTLKTRLQYMVLPKSRVTSSVLQLPILTDLKFGLKILVDSTRSPHTSFVEPTPERGSRTLARLRAGASSLYRGVAIQLLGVLPIAMVYMPTYEFTKEAVRGTVLEQTPAAGVATGIASAIARVPVSVVKSRLQLGLDQSARAAVQRLVAHGGYTGLYSGFRATVALDVWYAAVQFTVLENMRSLALRRASSSRANATQLTTGENAAIGFATGVIAAILSEPLDVMRTRMMTQDTHGRRGPGNFGYEGVAQGLQKAIHSESVLALWKGLLPRLLTKALGTLLWYTTYMEARRCFAKARQRLA